MTTRKELVRRAQDAEDQGDVAMLEESLQRLVDAYPNDPLGHAWLGQAMVEQRKWDRAFKHLDAARSVAPNDPGILMLWSVAARGVGRVGEVVKVLREAAREQPSAPLLVILASALQEMGLDTERLAALEKASELEPTNEEVSFNLAVAVKRTDPERALKLLESAVSVDPEYWIAFRELAHVYMAAGDWAKAEMALEQVARLNPDDARAMVYRGMLALRLERIAEAEDFLKQAKTHEDLPVIHWLLGDIHSSRGETDLANAEYEEAITLSPYTLEGLKRLPSGEPEGSGSWQELLKAMIADDELLRDLAGG